MYGPLLGRPISLSANPRMLGLCQFHSIRRIFTTIRYVFGPMAGLSMLAVHNNAF